MVLLLLIRLAEVLQRRRVQLALSAVGSDPQHRNQLLAAVRSPSARAAVLLPLLILGPRRVRLDLPVDSGEVPYRHSERLLAILSAVEGKRRRLRRALLAEALAELRLVVRLVVLLPLLLGGRRVVALACLRRVAELWQIPSEVALVRPQGEAPPPRRLEAAEASAEEALHHHSMRQPCLEAEGCPWAVG